MSFSSFNFTACGNFPVNAQAMLKMVVNQDRVSIHNFNNVFEGIELMGIDNLKPPWSS